MLLVNKLFCTKKRYKGYALKAKRGGYTTSTLGFRSFMPKSHSDRLLINKAPIEWLIGLKITQRRKRFSVYGKRTHVNVVSSSKAQKKSVRLKRGEKVRGQGYFWRNVAAGVNKRIKKESIV